jgi:hypothetical protein
MSDRLRFYEGNFEHAQSQANFEVYNSSHVDIYGIKLEGSTTILWIRSVALLQAQPICPVSPPRRHSCHACIHLCVVWLTDPAIATT